MSPNARLASALVIASLIVGGIACGSGGAPTSAPVIKTATPESGIQAPTTTPQTNSPAPTNTSAPVNTPAPTETPKPTETYLGDSVEQGGYFITALRVEDPATPGILYQAEAGKRLVAVEVVIGNISGDKLSANPFNFTLLDSDGFTYKTELGARDDQLATLGVQAGEKLKGWVAFMIPESAKPAKLKFELAMFSGQTLEIGLLTPPNGHTAMTVNAERQAPELAKLGDVVEVSGYSLSASAVEDPAQPGILYQAQKGTRLVAVEVVVGNVSGAQLSVNPLYFIVVDTDGFLYPVMLGGSKSQIDTLDLGVSEKVKGWLAFQIPDTAQLESIKFAPMFSDFVLQTGVTK